MRYYILLILVFLHVVASAQEKQEIQWITFEQLDDSLTANPKKVFIDFYTDWCTYCRKMDKVVFTKSEIVDILKDKYYAVRMDAESQDSIYFEGQLFINDQIKKTRKPVHQLAQILATQEGQFAPPTLLILDEDFNVQNRYYEYLDSKRLLKALR